MNDRHGRSDIFSASGSSITHGPLSPVSRTRNPLMRTKLKTEITVREMVGISSAYKWGIDDYIIPLSESQKPNTIKYSVPKEKNQTYMDKIIKNGGVNPDPAHYNIKTNWKGRLGVMKGGERQTFLNETMKISSKLPSPDSYSPDKHFKLLKGKVDKAIKPSHLDDIEFNADGVPGPVHSPNIEFVLRKTRSTKILPPGKHDQKKHWRVEQNDSPNPCSYTELGKATTMVQTNSPRFKFPKEKRSFFTDEIQKKKGNNPSPDRYNSINEAKVYKVMAKTRRY